MAEDRMAAWALDALEAYAAARPVTAAERRAFLAGVRAGIDLEREAAREGVRHVGAVGRRDS